MALFQEFSVTDRQTHTHTHTGLITLPLRKRGVMKGTEVPNPRRSSACDCTCVLTKIDHCLVTASVDYAYWLFRLFSRHISRTQSFQQNRHINFRALVALKLLVSLISRLVACTASSTDKQTNKQTNKQTHHTDKLL